MATVYACDYCKQTSQSISGWLMVSIQFMHDQPDAPFPPGGRTLDSTLPDYIFDKPECRDAWCTEKGFVVPAPIGTR